MTQQERGWPDRVLVRRRDRRLIFAELKKERGYPSPRQTVILDLLRCLEPRTDWEYDYATTADVVRIEVHLWRPSDILAIDAVLR